jgi:hypothetical protein
MYIPDRREQKHRPGAALNHFLTASILLTSHKHSADGIMLPIRPNTSSLSRKIVNDLILILDEAINEHVGCLNLGSYCFQNLI